MKTKLVHGIIISFMLTTSVSAYWWRFNNITNRVLLLNLSLAGIVGSYYALVFPDSSTLFSWPMPHILAGACLKSIRWMEPSNELLSNTSLISNKETVISNKKMTDFLYKNKITMNPVELFFTAVPLYEQTITAAQGLFPGGGAIYWGAQTHATSTCKSRNILITEDEHNHLIFLTTKS